jgi:hypothetical protein
MLLAWSWVDPQYRISPHKGCLGNSMRLLYKDLAIFIYTHTHTHIYIYIHIYKKKKAGKTEHTKPETHCTRVQTTQLYWRIWILLKFTYNINDLRNQNMFLRWWCIHRDRPWRQRLGRFSATATEIEENTVNNH